MFRRASIPSLPLSASAVESFVVETADVDVRSTRVTMTAPANGCRSDENSHHDQCAYSVREHVRHAAIASARGAFFKLDQYPHAESCQHGPSERSAVDVLELNRGKKEKPTKQEKVR